MEKIKFIVEKETRLDKLISETIAQTSRAKAQNMISSLLVLVNGKNVQKSYKAKIGDCVEVQILQATEIDVLPENIPLDIVFEDADVIVVNKQKGMVVHPAVGNYTGTLVNALLYHSKDSLSGINGKIRPGIVHRIDKDTSGLLIVAKNDFAHNILAKQISEHSFKREYEAVVYGNVKEENGKIEASIARNPNDRKKMAISNSPSAKRAITHYSLIEKLKGFSYLKLRLETGRTHQIRVHMASIGHPVAGDAVYGPKKVISKLNGQCLHAKTIGFIHPRTNEYMEFESELPECFKEFLSKNKEIN